MVEGRKKDLINRGGEKISAEEIENLILSHPAVKNVACIAVPDPDLGERMCACVILRDGRTLDARRAQDASCSAKEIAKYKLPERHRDHDRIPALDVRQGLEERSGRDGARAETSGRARADAMRIIDLHCYPNTREWIACQQPYVDALAKYWNRGWTAKEEDEVVQEFADRRRRGGAGRARSRDDRPHAAVLERLRRGDAEAPPRADHPGLGVRSIRSRATMQFAKPSTRSEISACWASTSTRSWAISRSTTARSTRCSRRSTRSRCR